MLLWGALVGGGPRAGAAQGNAPSAGRVITAEAIAKSGAKTAWDALRLAVPNVQLREVRGEPARIQRRGRASIYQEDQVRVFLLDKKALDSLGNAYADEVLFEAGIHPKTFCRSLSHDDAVRLHDAIVKVMTEAVAEVARREEPIDVKVRDFLKVRLKDTCPRCGTKIRTAGVRGMDAYFCPRCQPATRAGLVDWTRTGK